MLEGGPGKDRYEAHAGDDDIRARDGVVDVIDCGIGKEKLTFDPVESERQCLRD